MEIQKLTPSQRVSLWRKRNPEKRKKQWLREWQALKNNPERHKQRLSKRKIWDAEYWRTHKHKIKRLPYSQWTESRKKKRLEWEKIYRIQHPEQTRLYDKKAKDTALFGGVREIVIQRDNEQCLRCGMTRAAHYRKYHRDITVDHINRQGRGVSKETRDNRLENLQTLCISCHMKKDGGRNAKSK